jgi:hypothetical protein
MGDPVAADLLGDPQPACVETGHDFVDGLLERGGGGGGGQGGTVLPGVFDDGLQVGHSGMDPVGA